MVFMSLQRVPTDPASIIERRIKRQVSDGVLAHG